MARTFRNSVALALAATAVAAPLAPESVAATDRSAKTGIWKSVVPPGSMKGEFDNHDPVGLMAGKRIKADCSINWTDPDTGKLYCFTGGTSMSYFLGWPKANIERAARYWRSAPGS